MTVTMTTKWALLSRLLGICYCQGQIVFCINLRWFSGLFIQWLHRNSVQCGALFRLLSNSLYLSLLSIVSETVFTFIQIKFYATQFNRSTNMFDWIYSTRKYFKTKFSCFIQNLNFVSQAGKSVPIQYTNTLTE